MILRRLVTVAVCVTTIAPPLVFGTQPAYAFTEDLSNNFFGTGAGDSHDPAQAFSNAFFGGDAGRSNVSGDSNSFFGRSAGFSNAASNNNSFFGHAAGFANTADNNSFFGTSAGLNTSSGADNSFFGARAGLTNVSGLRNAFFGTGAGELNTASENAFFGARAGDSNTTGSGNTFIGRSAGQANVTGSNNAMLGLGAGFDSNASNNAFFGALAGNNTTTGDNAFFGAEAGQFNVTGVNNAFFGRAAGLANTASDNSFFGAFAGDTNTTGDNNAFFGNGVGTANLTGSQNAFFGSDTGASNTSGTGNAFFGVGTGNLSTTGNNNAFFGTFAGLFSTTEDNNSFIGGNTHGSPGASNATALGNRAFVSQSNSLVLGSIDGLNGATADVSVGIGTPAPAEPLHVRRDDGTAKVLVEEASATLEGRELFQLTNNGAARFRLRNTSNSATWDFQSSSGGGSFVIDRVGGPASLDFEIQPDGDAVHLGTVTAAGFVTSSDRTKKTDITSADAQKLVTLLRNLPISTWRFKDQQRGTINLGPMAQDFHGLFGMGTDTTIDVRDLAALALVAAQALDDRVRRLEHSADR